MWAVVATALGAVMTVVVVLVALVSLWLADY